MCSVHTWVAFNSTFQFYVTPSFDFFFPKHSCKLERICHPRLLLMVTCLFNPSRERAEQRRVRSHRGCCVSVSWRFETAKRGLWSPLITWTLTWGLGWRGEHIQIKRRLAGHLDCGEGARFGPQFSRVNFYFCCEFSNLWLKASVGSQNV